MTKADRTARSGSGHGNPMRFDLVDLQLFIAVAETRSITNGAQRVHLALASASERIKGLEASLGVVLLTRGRRGVELTAGRRKPARSRPHRHPQCRGDARRSRRLCPAAQGHRPHLLANTSGLSEYLPKTLAAFLRPASRTSRSTSRSAKAPTSPARSPSAPPISGSPPNTRLPDNIERMPFSEDRLVLVAARGGRTGEPAAGRFQRRGEARFRRPDQLDRAARPYQRTRGAARRASALSRAAEQFRCDRPDGGRRHRDRRDA